MNKLVQTELTCPYCGNVFYVYLMFHINDAIISRIGDHQVVSCDMEETDGCDRYFAVNPTLKVDVQTYKMVEYYE